MSLTNEFMIQLIKHDKTYNLKKNFQVKKKRKINFGILYFGLGICQSGVYLLYGIFVLHQSKCLYSLKTVETLGPNQKSDIIYLSDFFFFFF